MSDETDGETARGAEGPTSPSTPAPDPVPAVPAVPAASPWKHALVTGASRGLGAAIAESLARERTALTLIARDAPTLQALATSLRAAHGVDVRTALVDLADENWLAAWLERDRATLADVDLLVNNAAHADAAPFLELDDARVRATFATNLFAPMTLTRALLPGMLARRRGNVLNVVAGRARDALPLFSAYAASKGAMWSWSESLARELENTGVVVTTFVPPRMDTDTRRELDRPLVESGDAPARTVPIERVASVALDAARRGRRIVVPRGMRWQLALHALAAGPIERALRRRAKRRPGG